MSSEDNGLSQIQSNMIANNWRELPIGDTCYLIKKSYIPNINEKRKYIGLEHIGQETLKLIDIGNSQEIKSVKLNFKSGHILFGKLRPYFRKVYMPNFDGVCSTDFFVIQGKKEFDNKYLFYFFANWDIINEATNSSEGTRMPRASWEYLSNLKRKFPPLPEQKAIAKILSDLDEKIELNNEMNKTLEEIGQALFKKWFIDFEFPDKNGNPYRSSSGEMVYSEELSKEIPKGWEVKKLDELAKLEMGISPKGSSYNYIGQGLPLLNIGAADFNGKSIKPNKYTTSPTKTCRENDIIFCIRGTIGNITFSDSIYCIGRGVSSLSPYKDEYRELIFLSLNQYLNKLIKNAFGSVILGLSKEDISSLLILLPPGNTIKIFHNIVLKLNYLLKNNNIQSQELSELRDCLLPKLMSGEIRVPLEETQ